jgi:hypothetical protein
MKALSNDFTVDKNTLKLERKNNSAHLFDLVFKFKTKAPECQVTLF